MEKQTLYCAIDALVNYGIQNGLLGEEDRIYTTNRILAQLRLDSYEPAASSSPSSLETILAVLLEYAGEAGLLDPESVVSRDLFDTALMDCLLPRPAEVIQRFQALYKESPRKATDFYYQFSRSSDYIRTYRVAKDIKWTADTEYGELIITINLSKPEKDPKAIAAALKTTASSYPKCQLCKENEGYAGRLNHPARNNHRIIPITINQSAWFLQYSPYVYYNEHCIVFNGEHVPMKIDRAAFAKLLDFIQLFPHYMVGSNADLPIVGGSILTHDHFQGGRFEFPMALAPIETPVAFPAFPGVTAGIVNWPMSVLRLSSEDSGTLIDAADHVLSAWRAYSDPEAFLFAETEGVPHNTITPIARKRGDFFELDLVLRNNITTGENPDGVYHPHKEHHHIKKENIGLIEVMGLAILPARLKTELELVKNYLLSLALAEQGNLALSEEERFKNQTGNSPVPMEEDERIAKHLDWVQMIMKKYPTPKRASAEQVQSILQDEVAFVYKDILEQCAVFKRTEAGKQQFLRFIDSL